MSKIDFKNNKVLILVGIIVIVFLLVLIFSTFSSSDANVEIKPNEVSMLELEEYSTDVFSMKKPKGWTVETGGAGIYYAIRVYDPKDNNNQVFLMLKMQPLLKSTAGKAMWQNYYKLSGYNSQYKLFADAVVLSNPTTEGFYKVFDDVMTYAKNIDTSFSSITFPKFTNFTKLEEFDSNASMKAVAMDSKVLRGTFAGNSGKEGEGMFSASVVDFGSTPISSGQLIGYQLQTADGGYYMAYNVVAITAAKDTFIEWEPVLTECMNSLNYSDSFVSATNQASNEKVALSKQISQNFNETLNGIMSSWESRNKSQDIMSQKQSDATLGYERVYDTETNEVYKATNGFTDVYDGKRYKAVTDDNMYTEPVSGYIERVD